MARLSQILHLAVAQREAGGNQLQVAAVLLVPPDVFVGVAAVQPKSVLFYIKKSRSFRLSHMWKYAGDMTNADIMDSVCVLEN